MVDFEATCFDAPDTLAIMDTVVLNLRAYLRRDGTMPRHAMPRPPPRATSTRGALRPPLYRIYLTPAPTAEGGSDPATCNKRATAFRNVAGIASGGDERMEEVLVERKRAFRMLLQELSLQAVRAPLGLDMDAAAAYDLWPADLGRRAAHAHQHDVGR